MALATIPDVEAVLLRELRESEYPYVARLLDMAGAMVMVYGRFVSEPSPVPADITYVVAEMVARVLRNPEGFTSEMLGPYQYQRSAASLSLTDDLKALLGRYGSNGMVVVEMTSISDDLLSYETPWT